MKTSHSLLETNHFTKLDMHNTHGNLSATEGDENNPTFVHQEGQVVCVMRCQGCA